MDEKDLVCLSQVTVYIVVSVSGYFLCVMCVVDP